MGFGLIALVGGVLLMAVAGVTEQEDDLGEEVVREDDSIAGSEGDDVIEGNAASEWILPHTGDNAVDGEGGNDTISDYPWDQEGVSTGAGLVNPNWGSDTFSGGAGDDVLIASGGSDVVDGGLGNDRITGADLHPDAPHAPDLLQGGAGSDWLVGDDGDTLVGGSGVDFFSNVIDDPEDERVVVEDYEPGELLELLIYDPAMLSDGSEGTLHDTEEGAVLSINGFEAVVFRDAMAQDLNGNIRVVNAT